MTEGFPELPEGQDPDRAVPDDLESALMWAELDSTEEPDDEADSPEVTKVTPLDAALTTIRNFYFGDYICIQPEKRTHILLPESDGSDELTHHLEGEVPLAAEIMLDNLYETLGAVVKRHDHREGAASGIVVREGRHGDQPVHIAELFVDGERMWGDPDKSKLEVLIGDEAAAQTWLGKPSTA